jgi:hypothetical protein
MASNYSAWNMTDQFAAAQVGAAATGKQITWTRIIASSDTLQIGDIASLTNDILNTININQQVEVSNVSVSNNMVNITAILSSTNNDADYYANTLLLCASYNGTEFVAGGSIATGQATRVPAADANETTEFIVRPQIVVSKSSTISTTVNPIAAATNEYVDNQISSVNSSIDAINDTIDAQNTTISGMVSKALNETITGIKTFTQTIVGSITGNAGSATKLQTARNINGVAFNGTADIDVNAANDNNIMHLTGDESATGTKSFENLQVSGEASVNNLEVIGALTPTKEINHNIGWGQTLRLSRVGNMVFVNAADQIINGFGPLYSTDVITQDETLPIGYRPRQEFGGNATKIVTGNITVGSSNKGAYYLMFGSNGTIKMTRERDNPTGNVYVTLQTGFWFTTDPMPE